MFSIYTVFIVAYSLAGLPLLLLRPVPYGKHASKEPWGGYQINPRLAWFLMEVGGLFIWVGGYPTNIKGQICICFITIHFLWRACLSQLLYHYLEVDSGTKQTPIIVVIASMAYLILLGLSFSDMVTDMTGDVEHIDIAYLIGATSSLIGNIYCDVFLNIERKTGPYVDVDGYYGRYLTSGQLEENFELFTNLGIYNPNYFFEIMEWGFMSLFAFRLELFWWFISAIIFLVPRGIWNKTFYLRQNV